MLRIEPVRGSLMVWIARRTRLSVNRPVAPWPFRVQLRPALPGAQRTPGEPLPVAPRPCDCLSLSSDRPPSVPESPPLDLDWPGDRLPAPERVIVNTKIRYETKLITGVLDLFV